MYNSLFSLDFLRFHDIVLVKSKEGGLEMKRLIALLIAMIAVIAGAGWRRKAA